MDVLVHKNKGWNWTRGSVRHEQDTFTIVLEKDQQNEATTTQNEDPFKQNVRRSTRTRTELTRLAGYERDPDQEIDADGDLIGEVMMMMDRLELIELDQVMNESGKLRRTRLESLWTNQSRSQLCEVGLQVKTKAKW